MRLVYRLMIGVAVLAAPLLVMSGVWDNAHGFTGVLALVVMVVIALGRGIYRRTSSA